MLIDEPNTLPEATPDPAAAAAEAPTPDTPAEPVAPTDPDAAALAAFEAGMKSDELAAEAPKVDEAPADPAQPVADAKPDAKPEDTPAAKPSDTFGELPTDAKAETRERFGKLKESFDELHGKADPVLKLLDEKKIAAEALPDIVTRAERLDEWHGIIEDTRASPEQLSDAFNVIKAINSDDPAILAAVYDKLTAELAAIGKRIGKEAPGYDPLSEHADLLEAVQGGAMPREIALRTVADRATAAAATRANEARTTEQNTAAVQQQAMGAVAALNDRLKAGDPDFARKLPYLTPAIQTIRNSVAPQHWAAAIEQAYRQLPPLPPEPKPAPTPTAMPIRPTGASTQIKKPKNDMEAFEMGAAMVR